MKLKIALLFLSVASISSCGTPPELSQNPKPPQPVKKELAPAVKQETWTYTWMTDNGQGRDQFNMVLYLNNTEVEKFKIFEQYGCQWITSWGGGSYHGGPYFSHWGQCKYCKARREAEYDNLYSRITKHIDSQMNIQTQQVNKRMDKAETDGFKKLANAVVKELEKNE